MTRALRPRSSDPTYPARTLAPLRDPLDEPEFYGLDVPGCGANAPLPAALTAQAGKPNAPDDEYARRTTSMRAGPRHGTVPDAGVRSLPRGRRGQRSLWTRTDGSDWRRRITSASRSLPAQARRQGAATLCGEMSAGRTAQPRFPP